MSLWVERAAVAMVGLGLILGGPVPASAAQEPAAAEAEAEPTRVLVLPVELSGELPPNTATEMRALVSENLVDEGLAIDSDGQEVCTDDACRASNAASAGAEYVVGTQITGDEDEFSVTVTLFSGETGEALVPFEDGCSICGFVEVQDMVRLKALDARAELVRRRAIALAPPTEPDPEPPPVVVDTPPRSKLIPAGWGLAGAGAAATIGGVVLLGLHRQSAGCLDNPRGGECVPVRFTTAPAGAGVLGAGVLALTGGIVMIVLGRRAERKTKTKTQARLGPSGLTLRF